MVRTVKDSWRAWSRPENAVFDFRAIPKLVENIYKRINAPQVGILGGGRGLLAQLLKQRNPDLSIITTDIAPISQPLFRPSKILDAEAPYPRSELGKDDGKITAIFPFSFEYMDRRLAAARLGQALRPGDRCILACHDARSHIVGNFGKSAAIGEMIQALHTLAMEHPTACMERLQEVQLRLMRTFPGFLQVSVIDRPREQDSLIERHLRNGDADIRSDIVVGLNLLARIAGSTSGQEITKTQTIIGRFWGRAEPQLPVYQTLVRQAMQHPDDVAAFFTGFTRKHAEFIGVPPTDPYLAMLVVLEKV